MTGKPQLDIDISRAQPGSFVYDLIYTPRQTKLLREAKAAGCKTLGVTVLPRQNSLTPALCYSKR